MSSSVVNKVGGASAISFGAIGQDFDVGNADSVLFMSGIPAGTPAADRRVFVFAFAYGTSVGAGITDIEIDGVSATIHVSAFSASNTEAWALASRVVPSGNSVDVRVTCGGTKERCKVLVVPAYGVDVTTPVADTASTGSSTSSSHTLTGLTCPAGGARLAFIGGFITTSASVSWSGASETEDSWGSSSDLICSSALSLLTSGNITASHSSFRGCALGVGLTPAP